MPYYSPHGLSVTPSDFLSLPVEIRLMICGLLLKRDWPVHLSRMADVPADGDPQCSVLRTCGLINKEANSMIYGANTFLHHTHLIRTTIHASVLSMTGTDATSQMKKLTVVACDMKDLRRAQD